MSEIASLRTEREGELVVAAIGGEIDPSNARDLGRRLTDEVPNDAMGVVLDLTEVGFLDSSGVQMVFELAERLDSRQQRLAVVVTPGGAAQRVLDIVALDSTAPVAASREDAIARLSG